MMVLTFFNHAGGVAKTSTVRDVGYVLAEGGHRVLLIDMDPQANLTKWLGVDDDVDLDRTVYPAIIGDPRATATRRDGRGVRPAPADPPFGSTAWT
jgi:chromosome partitioning protein